MSQQHAGEPDPVPAVRASDAEREAVVARLQAAVGEGRISLDEFGQRVEGAYAAVTTADLDPLLADLPQTGSPRVEVVGSRPPAELSSVLGDIRLAGVAAVPGRLRTVLGDIRLDLRDLRTDADVVEVTCWTWFGDVDVVVAEGVDAELIGSTVLGDRVTDLAPLPRLAGTPRVVVRARSVLGDLRLRSQAPGESPGRWRAVLDRLASTDPHRH